jgi:predicted RNase H-like HicB family nuclease
MRRFVAIVERCPETGLYVGWVPGVPGAHSQGQSLDELHQNLQEVLQMLQEDGEIEAPSEFVGMQVITVA